jgi:hypothetical protein
MDWGSFGFVARAGRADGLWSMAFEAIQTTIVSFGSDYDDGAMSQRS